jgi:Ni,Fe-hydrogenase I small subunit
MSKLLPQLRMPGAICIPLRHTECTAKELFMQATYDDNWDDADIRGLVRYLYGAKGVKIPRDWRELMPHEL